MFQIPAHRLGQAVGQGVAGRPAQLAMQFCGIDGIAEIMAGTVGDEGDQIARRAGAGVLPVQLGAQALDQFKIAALGIAADIVDFTDTAALENGQQGIGMVLDMQPVADICAATIDRDGRAPEGRQDDDRDEFFRKLAR